MSKGFKRGPDADRYDRRGGNRYDKLYEQEEVTTCKKQEIANLQQYRRS